MNGLRGIRATSGSRAREELRATVMPSRSTDDEASALLDELSKLQGLMVMQMGRGPEWIAAADLVQRTRVLIIERCKKPSVVGATFEHVELEQGA